jgi:hypothetical protein
MAQATIYAMAAQQQQQLQPQLADALTAYNTAAMSLQNQSSIATMQVQAAQADQTMLEQQYTDAISVWNDQQTL